MASDGSVPLRGENERVAFQHLINMKHGGDQAELSILRNGEPMKIKLKV